MPGEELANGTDPSILETLQNFPNNFSTTPQFEITNSTDPGSTWTSTMSSMTTPSVTLSTLSHLFTTIGSTLDPNSTTFSTTNSLTTPTSSFTSLTPLMDLLSTPTPTTLLPPSEWTTPQLLAIILPTTFIMIFMILGNFLVILAILTQKNLRSPSNMYILSLSVTDLLVGLFILPFNVYDLLNLSWDLGHFLCRVWLTADVTLCSSSILHIAAIAVDRYRSINEGLSYAQTRTLSGTLGLCGGLWFLSLWIASPPMLGWNDWDKDKDVCEPTKNLGYIVHSATGAFFIPAIVLVGVYIRIYFLLRKKFRERAEMKCMDHTRSGARIHTETATPSQEDLESSAADTGIGDSSGEVVDIEENNLRERRIVTEDDTKISKKLSTKFFKTSRYRYSFKKRDPDTTPSTPGDLSESDREAGFINRNRRSRSQEGDLEEDKSVRIKTPTNSSTTSSQKKSTLQRFLARNTVQDERKPSQQITAIMQKKTKFSLNKERKAAKTLGILMFCFLFCWTPFTITYLLSGILPKGGVNGTFFQFVTWGGYVNSAINPIIYNMYSIEFKRAFKKLVLVWRH